MSKIKDALIDQMNDTPTHFLHYSLIGKDGWQILGVWGLENKGEFQKIGEPFEKLALAVAKCHKLEAEFGLPVPIQTIIQHFENTQLVTSH